MSKLMIVEVPSYSFEFKGIREVCELVRCVECRYKGMEICPMYKLTKVGVLKPYSFCSYGEKKDNEGYN